jgi:glycosyltransferase involved in cell wall biosynthesis
MSVNSLSPNFYLWCLLFSKNKPTQILHSHRYKENILAFFARGVGRGTRLVATQHGMPEPGYGSLWTAGRFAAGLNRYILPRHFDRLVAVSRDIQDSFVGQLGFSPLKVSVIHNGIELPEMIASGRSGSVMMAGSAGRLFPVKDYPLMVEIARVVSEQKAPIRFKLAGDGPERSRLEKLIAARGLDHSFKLCGNLENMGDFYPSIDVYLNTSMHEGIPMSCLEAMAHGLPVIAPLVGGIDEIIEDGVEGFLVTSRNPEEFAERCLLLQDSKLRQRMGQAARNRIQSVFTAEYMAQQYYQLYSELAG